MRQEGQIIREDGLALLWQFQTWARQMVSQLKRLNTRLVSGERIKKGKNKSNGIFKKRRSGIGAGGSLCTHSLVTYFSTSLPALSVPPGALWWKNAKWSCFCEHHLAAPALIAPITSLTSLPTYYTTVAHLTLCSTGWSIWEMLRMNRFLSFWPWNQRS